MSANSLLRVLGALLVTASLGGCVDDFFEQFPSDITYMPDLLPPPDLSPDQSCSAGLTACNGACINLNADVAHCGTCDNACPPGDVCSSGACALHCPSGQMTCSGSCFNLMSDNTHCGDCATSCTGVLNCVNGVCACPSATPDTCSGQCTNTKSDTSNCGACGTVCNSTQLCASGACADSCAAGQLACPVSQPTFCANIDSDNHHCGDCSTDCTTTQQWCQKGKCITLCSSPQTLCGSTCVDTRVDPSNCGACGTQCATAQFCNNGVCSSLCGTPLTSCSGVCTDTRNDPDHCGDCTTACSTANHVATRGCTAGACFIGSCASGFFDCDNQATTGCEVDASADPKNCGACGKTCGAHSSCSSSKCTCATGYLHCSNNAADGCEVDSTTDANNCGACGNACGAGNACISGVCHVCSNVPSAYCMGQGTPSYAATIKCPGDQIIKQIVFASYGTPGGTCGSYTKSGCDAATSLSVVQAACVNRNTCTVNSDNCTFGDPCPFVVKSFSIEGVCQDPPGPIGSWQFSGNTNDSSGNGHSGTNHGATLTTDKAGNANSAYAFNGSSYIVMSVPSLPQGAAPRTLSVWYKTTVTTSQVLSEYGNVGGLTVFGMFDGSAGYDLIGWDSVNNVTSNVPVADGSWHNAVVTYDGTVMKLWRDGMLLGTNTTALNTTGTNLYVGARADLSTWFWNGSLDDVRVWDHALSQSELSALSTAGPQ